MIRSLYLKRNRLARACNLFLCLSLLFALIACKPITKPDNLGRNTTAETTLAQQPLPSPTATQPTATTEQKSRPDGSLIVHFIDVGQGDAILVQQGQSALLIDGGSNLSGPVVSRYLLDRGITQLDWIIATHPHEDHIGGLYDILQNIAADTLLLPDVAHATQSFANLLDIVERARVATKKAIAGETITWGQTDLQILGPHSTTDSLNNASVVCRIAWGRHVFLFTGDAEALAESFMIEAGYPLSATVLKLAHHGSSTSTSPAFLDRVNPVLAILSVGRDNPYGQPDHAVLQILQERQIRLFRTDYDGTIVVMTDGEHLTVQFAPSG
jgi:competence protein ComEC